MNKRKFQIPFTIFCLVLLFVFPDSAFEGAKNGLLLWFNVVLPTLLPFLIFSNLFVHLNITRSFSIFLYPVLKHIMPISPDGCYPVAIGLLSGYPMGAKACADMTTTGKISSTEGQFLLSFCNNASPMFLLNYLFLQSLHVTDHLPIFMGIMLGSSLLCGYIYLFIHRNELNHKTKRASAATLDNEAPSIHIQSASDAKLTYFQILDLSIMNSFEVITKIGGYIILFSLLANLISHFAPFSDLMNGILIGVLEITTGIQYISTSSLTYPVKILTATALSAFGGLSSVAQTGSVLLDSPLALSTYVKYKLLNSLICFLAIFAYLHFI